MKEQCLNKDSNISLISLQFTHWVVFIKLGEIVSTDATM